MSAFMVSIPHVDAIVDAARQYQVQVFDQASADRLGQDLLRECARSVVSRYRLDGSDEAAHYERLAAGYRHTPGKRRSTVEIAKLCECYAYQACEHDGWEASAAAAFIGRLREALLRALPGYGAAPWAID